MSKRKPQRGDFTNGGAEKVWKEIILRRSTGMKITPTLEECKIIAAEGGYGVIPISTELYADMTTTYRSVAHLKKRSAVMSICWKARRRISDGDDIPF